MRFQDVRQGRFWPFDAMMKPKDVTASGFVIESEFVIAGHDPQSMSPGGG